MPQSHVARTPIPPKSSGERERESALFLSTATAPSTHATLSLSSPPSLSLRTPLPLASLYREDSGCGASADWRGFEAAGESAAPSTHSASYKCNPTATVTVTSRPALLLSCSYSSLGPSPHFPHISTLRSRLQPRSSLQPPANAPLLVAHCARTRYDDKRRSALLPLPLFLPSSYFLREREVATARTAEDGDRKGMKKRRPSDDGMGEAREAAASKFSC